MICVIRRDEYKKYTYGEHVVGKIFRNIEFDDLIELVVSPSHLESHALENDRWDVTYLAVFNQEVGSWFITILSYDPEKISEYDLAICYRVSLW